MKFSWRILILHFLVGFSEVAGETSVGVFVCLLVVGAFTELMLMALMSLIIESGADSFAQLVHSLVVLFDLGDFLLVLAEQFLFFDLFQCAMDLERTSLNLRTKVKFHFSPSGLVRILSRNEFQWRFSPIKIAILEEKLVPCGCLRDELTVLFCLALIATAEPKTLEEMRVSKLFLTLDTDLVHKRNLLGLLLVGF